MRYFICDGMGGSEKGPYEISELRSLALDGALDANARLRPEKSKGAIRADFVVGVFGDEIRQAPRPTDPARGPSRFAMAATALLLGFAVVVMVLSQLAASLLGRRHLVALRATAKSRLTDMTRATLLYAADHDDTIPSFTRGPAPIADVSDATAGVIQIRPYLTVGSIDNTNPAGSSWQFNGQLGGKQLPLTKRNGSDVMYRDYMPWNDGKLLASTTDGGIKLIAKDQIESGVGSGVGLTISEPPVIR